MTGSGQNRSKTVEETWNNKIRYKAASKFMGAASNMLLGPSYMFLLESFGQNRQEPTELSHFVDFSTVLPL